MKTIVALLAFFITPCLFAQSNSAQLAAHNSTQQQVFTYQLATKGTTSAGIYNSDHMLVRTLWAQKEESAGTHSGLWDGLDDLGKPMPPDNYSWKVLTNNVKYTWQGVIGNTSDSMSGPTKHKGYQPVVTMCFAGGYGYYGIAYSEAYTATFKFDTSHPGQKTMINPIPYGMAPVSIRNCTDGNYVYWLGYDVYNPMRSFVYATKVIDDSRIVFPNGTNYAVTNAGNQPPYNVIGFENDVAGNATDVAVQRNGKFLFLARNNEIIVLNKTSGILIDSIFLRDVQYVRTDATDGYLWIMHGGDSTTRYIINDNGALTSTDITVVSNQPVVGIDCNNSYLAICEGGNSQIIKFYDPVTGIFIKSFGQAGGYLTNATVSNNKFYWNDARGTYPAFISFTPNGSFWVGDYGNGRAQHYGSRMNYVNRIAWIAVSYNCGADYSSPSRVFADMKEYKVDWTKPLDNGADGSWTLVRNWGGDVTATQYNPYKGLITPMTFSNGHTFCFLPNGNNKNQLVELNADGTKNYTGVMISNSWYLNKLGDLYSQTRTSSNQTIVWSKISFTNTYHDNQPVWTSSATVLQTSPIQLSVNEPGFQGYTVSYRPDCITDDSVFVGFSCSTVRKPGYHLGGVKNGKWLFKTALATSTSYNGSFPTGEKFDIGNGVLADGTVCVPLGKTVIWGYNGEFWKASQTNMFTQTYSNGLIVNQFGVATGKPAGDRSINCYRGDAGNAFSVHIVQLKNGNIFLIHNDESIQGGIHVWKITGIDTIQLLSGKFSQ